MKLKCQIMGLIGALSVILAGCDGPLVTEIPQTPTYSAKTEALYLKRYNARGKPQATALKAYDTLGPIYGTQAYEKLPMSQTRAIAQPAIDKAHDYVANMNTSAFKMKLGQTLRSEPYLAADLFMFDGNSHQTAYIIPSADMVILRTGNWVPEGRVWDNSQPPKILLKGIKFEAGAAPVPQQ